MAPHSLLPTFSGLAAVVLHPETSISILTERRQMYPQRAQPPRPPACRGSTPPCLPIFDVARACPDDLCSVHFRLPTPHTEKHTLIILAVRHHVLRRAGIHLPGLRNVQKRVPLSLPSQPPLAGQPRNIIVNLAARSADTIPSRAPRQQTALFGSRRGSSLF